MAGIDVGRGEGGRGRVGNRWDAEMVQSGVITARTGVAHVRFWEGKAKRAFLRCAETQHSWLRTCGTRPGRSG